MAGIKISDLPAAPSAQLTDVFPVDQLPGPVTYKESNSQLITLFKTTGEALTKVDDTNVTMALAGAPNIALLNAASMTLGWTGQLAVPRGGTGNSTFTAYSVICAGTTATGAFQNVVGLGTAGQQLTSNGPGALPTWQASGAVTPAALTKVDDTNVTLTLGGTPATALLQAVSITAGWTGVLAETRGGTGTGTYTLGDTLYASAANTLSKLPGNITTAKQYLSQIGTGAVSAAPAWATISGGDITGAALTKTDDTNVTMVLGGTPTTALLQATSMTLGWSGQLSVPRGGTANSTFTAYSVICAGTTATGAFQNVSGVGTANQVLVSNGAAALPTWQSVPGLTPAALTKVDDTNVTLTLGGTPTTALLQATSVTAGWTGQLSLTRGGTNASLTASTGGIVYSDASSLAILTGTATAGQIVRSGASAAPTWSTATYPATAGTSGNVLTSDGTNWVSSAAASVGSVATQIFTGSGTYTPTSGMKFAYIEEWGGGGAGGGNTDCSGLPSNTANGGGGGAGGYGARLFTAAQVGASASVTIGAAGTGSAGAIGGTGGTTSIALTGSGTITMTATGGVGGAVSISATLTNGQISQGGLGGTNTNAEAAYTGAVGGSGMSGSYNSMSGTGASSSIGGGGKSKFSTSGAVAGDAATGFASGGGGATAIGTATLAAGGNGSPGFMRITEYL